MDGTVVANSLTGVIPAGMDVYGLAGAVLAMPLQTMDGAVVVLNLAGVMAVGVIHLAGTASTVPS